MKILRIKMQEFLNLICASMKDSQMPQNPKIKVFLTYKQNIKCTKKLKGRREKISTGRKRRRRRGLKQ